MLIDLVTAPRKTTSALVLVVSPVAAIFAWLDASLGRALGATALFAGAMALSVIAALEPRWQKALWFLAPAIILCVSGFFAGFVGA